MNLTRLEKAVVQRKFIRYCIKVLDGEALNYLDEMDKIWEREINFSELREEILDGFCSYDEFMEIRYFQIMGMEVPVKDGHLAGDGLRRQCHGFFKTVGNTMSSQAILNLWKKIFTQC